MTRRYSPKDLYFHKAKREGFRSRSAFKLIEINQKYKLIKKGGTVVDLGAFPGGWSQVALSIVGDKGKVVGVDLQGPVTLGGWFSFLQGDITDPEIQSGLYGLVGGGADVVLSDMAPATSGVRFADSVRSYGLAREAFHIACKVLKRNGHLVVKIFPGTESAGLKKEMAKRFREVSEFIPQATRATSREVYFIARGFLR